MLPPRYLLIDSLGIRAFRRQRRRLIGEAEFPDAPSIAASLDAYLQSCRPACFTLLLNLADERCTIEHLPPLGRRDRQALLDRRLDSRFPDHPLRFAQALGDKFGEQNLLLYAQSNNELLDVCLSALQQTDSCLAAIHPLAATIAGLADASSAKGRRTLLACPTRTGLRLVLAADGRLVFTRLAVDLPAADGHLPSLADIGNEIARTRSYLLAQRLMTADSPSGLVMHRQRYDALAQHTDLAVPLLLDTATLSRRPGSGATADELLMLHALTERAPSQQLAPAGLRQRYRHRRIGIGLHLASAALFASNLLVSGYMLWRADLLDAEQATAIERQEQTRQALQAVLAELSTPTASPEVLADLSRFVDSIEQRNRLVAAQLLRLSRALDQLPQLELRHLSWQLEPDAGGASRVDMLVRLVAAGPAPLEVDRQSATERLLTLLGHDDGAPPSAGHTTMDDGRWQLELHFGALLRTP